MMKSRTSSYKSRQVHPARPQPNSEKSQRICQGEKSVLKQPSSFGSRALRAASDNAIAFGDLDHLIYSELSSEQFKDIISHDVLLKIDVWSISS